MKFNKWTVGLAAVGVVSLASAARADEKMNAVQTVLSNTTLSGYVDTAAQWNPGTDKNTSGGPNLPSYSFARDDGFSLNAVDIALDHPEDESPWAAGYHVELMLGPDVPTGINAFGAPTTTPYDATASLRQAYLTLRTPVGNGIDWKIGVFDTIIGYESTSDPLNPNYTRSYGYTIEPTTHTGVLATYKINDMVTVSAGIANTWSDGPFTSLNTTSTVESQKTYMGSIAFTAPDSAGFMKGATLTLGGIDSAGLGTAGSGAGAATSLYAGATIPTPVTALKVGAAFDYLDVHNSGPGNVNGIQAEAIISR
ncbi:MAG: outer membrane beta-barrel protein, partial [Limisphaerales bacterium]